MRILFFASFFLFLSCKKQSVPTSEVIYDLKLTPSVVDADGTSNIAVSVKINKDADASKRKVVLETSSGNFASNGTKTITLDAVYENGLLVATTNLKAPTSPGYVVVTAKPENRNPYNDFFVKDSVQAVSSEPATIKAEASSFSVSTDYISDVLITGILKNLKNKNVSVNHKVIFEDYYVNTLPVNGRFRSVQTSSDENSKVSIFYSPGHVPPSTDLYVRCTVLDNAGNKTGIKDSVLLSVIP